VNRSARWAAWLSIGSLLGIVPHVMEDLRFGQPRNFNMTTMQFEWFSGAVVLATAAVAMACLAGRRWGLFGVMLFGLAWSILGAADHLHAFLPGGFREGISSRLWVLFIVGFQAAAAAAAATSLLRRSDSRTPDSH
jgi:hypothetical protein